MNEEMDLRKNAFKCFNISGKYYRTGMFIKYFCFRSVRGTQAWASQTERGMVLPPVIIENLVMGVSGLHASGMLKEQIHM